MAIRKRTSRKEEPKSIPCPECRSEGEISVPVLVGRKMTERGEVGKQLGWCLACCGTGIVPSR